MKKNLLFLLFLPFIAISCMKTNQIPPIENKIEGKWELNRVEFYSVDSTGKEFLTYYLFDSLGLEYNFYSNGDLSVYTLLQWEYGGYSTGSYKYEFRRDYIGKQEHKNEPKYDIVDIEGDIWIFSSINENEVALDQTYVDGIKMFFTRLE